MILRVNVSLEKEFDMHNIITEMDFKDCGAYIDIGADESILDGYFTSKELIKIANSMDELKTIFLVSKE